MPGIYLRADKVAATAERLSLRIHERFPGSGMHSASQELVRLAHKALEQAASISRPIYWVRIAVAVLIAAILAIITSLLWVGFSRVDHFTRADLPALLEALEAGTNELVLVGLAILFLVTLERRIKRTRLLGAVHELRSLAHVIDMHQLTKEPGYYRGQMKATRSSPSRTLSLPELIRYLDYCSECLSLVSKIAAIYGQDFRDSVVIEAISDVEVLCDGFSRKIWQKMTIAETLWERLR